MTQKRAPTERIVVLITSEQKKLLDELQERLGIDTSSAVRIGILQVHRTLIGYLEKPPEGATTA